MLGFLKSFFGRAEPQHEAVHQLYTTLITQARHPVFYRDLGVTDSVEGRLEMIYLHLFMVFHRLREENTPLKQDLFDLFVAQTDANLREMSVGDLKVPKLMKAVGQNFYGRLQAYTAALESPSAMQAALIKNISIEKAQTLSDYVFQSLAALQETSLNALTEFKFPELKLQ